MFISSEVTKRLNIFRHETLSTVFTVKVWYRLQGGQKTLRYEDKVTVFIQRLDPQFSYRHP
jgi:hypothetical protein